MPQHFTAIKRFQILEAEFVEPAIGTGLVMSVPAHAPKGLPGINGSQG